MVRKKDQSSTPQSSTTGSSSSGSSSSSSSGSSSSESSSSSDTEASSAVSTRSRTRSRGPSSDKDVSQKSFPSLTKATHPPLKTPSSSYSTGGVSKKGEKCDSLPKFPTFPVKKRASSESAPDPVCSANKRGPKTTATSVPKSHTRTKSAISSKSHVSSSLKTQSSKKATPKKPSKKSPIKEVARDKKHRSLAAYSAENSSESERETRSHKCNTKQKPLVTPSKSTSRSIAITPKLSFLSQKQSSPESKSSRKGIKSLQKSSENSTNSSRSSSGGSDSESCSESSQGGRDKSIEKKDVISSETEKDDEDGDQQQDNASRRLVTRSSSVKTKRSSLLGINKTCTDSDSEIVIKPRKGNKPNEVKKCVRPLISSSQFDEVYVHEPCSKARSNVKKTTQKVKNNMLENVPLPPIETRSCPVEGCNSTGHLGGLYERHFTVEACPVFHNITKAQSKNNRVLRLQDNDDRERAMGICTKSPRHSQKMEQRNYCNTIRDSRDRMSEVRPGDEEMADSDRQASLRGLTPDWDLQLFVQAQADASEKNEDEMRGLPDTKGIRYIQMGHFEMEAWYLSQYPDDYNQQPKIYVCEFCLKYMRSKTILMRHADKCVWKHPPGDEIYRKEKLSVWEVDGTKYKTYCQNLCLLAMLFLDHKTLYYDVEPFLFYIMTIADAEGCHTVGYFSKEKNSFLNYNVSCIMTLPQYQRQGFGRLLIDFSYLLTREEGKIGSPEKPLSDLGLISYRSYWNDLLLKHLSNFSHKNVSVKDLSAEMAVSPYDIVSTFQAMGMMKYWKGKHILLKRQDLFEGFQERRNRRVGANKEIDPSFLNWRPYVPPIPPIEDPNPENKDKNNKGGNGKRRPTDLRSGSGESTISLPVKSKRPLIQHLTNGEHF